VRGGQAMIERVFVFATGLVGRNDQQLRRLMRFTKSGPDGHRHAGLQLDLSGPELVTEGLEQGSVQLLVGVQALGGFAQAGERGECGKPLAAETSEAFVRCPAFGTGFRSGFASRKRLRGSFFGGLPALDQGTDVALENLGQIVVAVELVLVGDAGKALDGLGDGHGRFFRSFSGFSARRRPEPG
jgi:hypothetical protein